MVSSRNARVRLMNMKAATSPLLRVAVLLPRKVGSYIAAIPRSRWSDPEDASFHGLDYLVIAIPAILAILHSAFMWENTIDDAAISFAYAENIAHGEGPVAFPGGPPVQGFTNGLFVIFLLIPGLMGLPIHVCAKVIGVIGFAGACGMLSLLLLRNHPGRRLLGMAGGLLLAGLPSMAIWSVSGLENGPFALVIVLLVYEAMRSMKRPYAPTFTGLWMTLLVMLRPDGILFVIPVASIITSSAVFSRPHRRLAMEALLPPTVLLCLWFMGLSIVFGYPLPNTYLAKASYLDGSEGILHGMMQLRGPGWKYISEFLGANGLVVLLPLSLACLSSRQGRMTLLVAGSCYVCGLALPLFCGGDWMNEWRFMTFGAPLLMLLIGDGLCSVSSLLERALFSSNRRMGPRLLAVLIFVLCAFHTLPRYSERFDTSRGNWSTQYGEVRARAEVFQTFANRIGLHRRAIVADVDAGGHLYPASSTYVDLGWLTDYTLARIKRHRGYYREYLFHEQQPDFIHLHGAWLAGERLTEYAEWKEMYYPVPRFDIENPVDGVDPFVAESVFLKRLILDPFASPPEWVPDNNEPGFRLIPNCPTMMAVHGELSTYRFHVSRRRLGIKQPDVELRPCRGSSIENRAIKVQCASGFMDIAGIKQGEPIPCIATWVDHGGKEGSCRELHWVRDDVDAPLAIIVYESNEVVREYADTVASSARIDLTKGLSPLAGTGMRTLSTLRSLSYSVRSWTDEAWRDKLHSWEDSVDMLAHDAASRDEALTGGRLLLAASQFSEAELSPQGYPSAKKTARKLFDHARDLYEDGLYDTAYEYLVVSRGLNPGNLDSLVLLEKVRPFKANHESFIEGTLQLQIERKGAREGLSPLEARSLLASYLRTGLYGRAARCLDSSICQPVLDDRTGRALVALIYLDLGLDDAARSIDFNTVSNSRWSMTIARHVSNDNDVESLLRSKATSFETGTFEDYSVSGYAFGRQPDESSLAGQSEVAGFSGKYFVNSFHGGDTSTGVLRSQPESIHYRYFGMLVGGGVGKDVKVQLINGSRVFFEARGNGSEFLNPAVYDVSRWAGQQSRVEIVDAANGSWGHILVFRSFGWRR